MKVVCEDFRERSLTEKDLRSHVPAYHCKWVIFGFFAKTWHGKFFYLGLLLFLELQVPNENYSFPKDQERTTLPSTTSDRQRAGLKSKNVCKPNGGTRWRELESTDFVISISARNTELWAFFERCFQALSAGGFFSRTNEKRLVIAPRAHFRQKLKIDKKAQPELLLQAFLDATCTQQHVILDSTYKKRWSGLKAYSNPIFSFLNYT